MSHTSQTGASSALPSDQLLFADAARDLELRLVSGYSADFAALIARTIWGTDGLRYLSFGLEEEFDRIPELYTLELREAGRLVGCYALGAKSVRIGSERLRAIHRMFLAVDAERLGAGYGRLLVDETRRHFLEAAGDPLMLYGYIEADNRRSLRLAEATGYQRLGSFESSIFNRFRPRHHEGLETLAEAPAARAEEARVLLEESYAEHALNDLERSFEPESYVVIRRAGRLVAGVQAQAKRWRLVDLGGFGGRFLLAALKRTPVVRRVLPDGELRFLALTNVFCRPGEEAALWALVETLLARRGLNVAMLLLDPRSDLHQRMRRFGHRGVMSKFGVDAPVHVMAGFRGVDPTLIGELTRRPLFISPHDPT